jgi:hypothetical protein
MANAPYPNAPEVPVLTGNYENDQETLHQFGGKIVAYRETIYMDQQVDQAHVDAAAGEKKTMDGFSISR